MPNLRRTIKIVKQKESHVPYICWIFKYLDTYGTDFWICKHVDDCDYVTKATKKEGVELIDNRVQEKRPRGAGAAMNTEAGASAWPKRSSQARDLAHCPR